MSLSSPSSKLPPARAAWWLRLHAALMPDDNRRAAVYWWLMVFGGSAVTLACVSQLLQTPWQRWAAAGLGMVLAVGAGLFPIRLPGTKTSFAAGEMFLFLVLLALGPAAAALVAGVEALTGSWRTSKRWTSRIASPAIAVLTMAGTGGLLHAALEALRQADRDDAAAVLAVMLAFSVLYFAVNSVLMSSVQRLKRNESLFHWIALFIDLRWVGLAYAGSAVVATLLFVTYEAQGSAVLLVMVPLLAMLLVSLNLYFDTRKRDGRWALHTPR